MINQRRSTASMIPILLPLLALTFIPPAFGLEPLKGAKVGEWAEYQVTTGEGKGSVMRRSIVGKEGNLIWYETKTSHDNQVTIMKVLIDPDTGKAKRAIMKNPPKQAMEIPLNMMDKMAAEPAQKNPAQEKPIVTSETIQVPAGSFKCTHVRGSKVPSSDGVWSSEKVPVGGLVKSRFEDHEMVLTGLGRSGAKSEITETPQKMPSMKGMMRGTMPKLPAEEEGED